MRGDFGSLDEAIADVIELVKFKSPAFQRHRGSPSSSSAIRSAPWWPSPPTSWRRRPHCRRRRSSLSASQWTRSLRLWRRPLIPVLRAVPSDTRDQCGPYQGESAGPVPAGCPLAHARRERAALTPRPADVPWLDHQPHGPRPDGRSCALPPLAVSGGVAAAFPFCCSRRCGRAMPPDGVRVADGTGAADGQDARGFRRTVPPSAQRAPCRPGEGAALYRRVDRAATPVRQRLRSKL